MSDALENQPTMARLGSLILTRMMGATMKTPNRINRVRLDIGGSGLAMSPAGSGTVESASGGRSCGHVGVLERPARGVPLWRFVQQGSASEREPVGGDAAAEGGVVEGDGAGGSEDFGVEGRAGVE